MIVIFTIEEDFSTNNVVRILKYYNQKVIRININDGVHKFLRISENQILFTNDLNKEVINLLDIKSCWWRRNGLNHHNFIDDIPEELRFEKFDLTTLIHGTNSLLKKESADLIEFIYNKIYANCKINLGKPAFNLNKLMVLDLAKKHGLKIPSYEIIRSSLDIQEKLREGKHITKAINNGIYTVIDNHRFYSYTELIELEDSTAVTDKEIAHFPSLVMNLIEKRSEIRTFFMEGKFYSMIIFSQSSDQTSVDFRKYNEEKPNRTEPYKLPISIEQKLINIFTELGFNSGSVDLIIDDKDEFVFLEINPVGQYGMVSDPCNYNLDDLIAKYLIYGETR
ncbi:grasp-with-spasm system ATP-grasp peptide maturase [uncultured Flavobacterium sp.]|uniref:grasp-with-spasm system ATP-grasp peptide maturase n=1 Tax=uncultured Flavobacterium sp. TaxID=165435 RepID=UPI0025997BF9|nr:grasp-with-spasm system ATP-grasp peptide maturase [uncultured Flavobacterium sp.]